MRVFTPEDFNLPIPQQFERPGNSRQTPQMVIPPMGVPSGGGLASSDYPAGGGIAGGIGGNAGGVDSLYGFQFPNNGSMDGKEYKFLNDFIGYLKQPETVAPNFSGPSADYGYGNPQPISQPVPGAPAPKGKTTTVSAMEGDQLYQQSPTTQEPQTGYGYGNQEWNFDNYNLPPMQQPSVRPTVSYNENYPVVPDYRDVKNQSFLDRNGMDIAKAGLGALIPGAGSALALWNAGNAAYNGYQEGKSGGPLGTQYAIGDGQSTLPVSNDPSLLSKLFNMSGTIGGAIGNAIGSSVGGAPIQAMTDAEKSLMQAYGQKSVYDPNGTGWQTAPSTPSAPGPMASYDEWAQAYPEFAAPVTPDLSWSDLNGPAWGFNADASGYGGRYVNNPTYTAPTYTPSGNSSLESPGWLEQMWGPMSRFVSGDPNNTD